MKSRFLALFLYLLFSSFAFAINEEVWHALNDGYLAWAMEMINDNRVDIDFNYAPPGEGETIYEHLKRYDVIRSPDENSVTPAEQKKFAGMICGVEPNVLETTKKLYGSRIVRPKESEEVCEWLVIVEGQTSAQVEDFIRICGRCSLQLHKKGYTLLAKKEQIVELLALPWVLGAEVFSPDVLVL